MTNSHTDYHVDYPYGGHMIPVLVQVFDDGRKEIFVSSEHELFKQIVHRSSIYLDKTDSNHFYEEMGNPPAVFSCFSDIRCNKFLKGLLFTILADYNIVLRLFQVGRN